MTSDKQYTTMCMFSAQILESSEIWNQNRFTHHTTALNISLYPHKADVQDRLNLMAWLWTWLELQDLCLNREYLLANQLRLAQMMFVGSRPANIQDHLGDQSHLLDITPI